MEENSNINPKQDQKPIHEEQKDDDIDNQKQMPKKDENEYSVKNWNEKIMRVALTSENSVEVETELARYSYKRTKKTEDIWYFQCKNRNRAENSGKKCIVTAQYDVNTKKISLGDPHLESCNEIEVYDSKKIPVQNDYQAQKSFLIDKLNKNQSITPKLALDMLRSDNLAQPLEERKVPLNYNQASHIIKEYRKDNNINSDSKIMEEENKKTIDNAIFLRANCTFQLSDKSLNILIKFY